MQAPAAHLHQVLPTTQVETAEERLVRDVEELISTVHTTDSPFEIRRDEAHVAVDERRVFSLRALPCHRCGRQEDDVRWTLAAAYDELAVAYRERGVRDRSAWASGRALQERSALRLAA